jgi:CBS domain-containing protein
VPSSGAATIRPILPGVPSAEEAVAEDLDPRRAVLAEVVTHDLVAVSKDDDLDTAVELMRTHAVRRLPVLDGERLVGVVSLGDLAVEREKDSALAQISAEEPNN